MTHTMLNRIKRASYGDRHELLASLDPAEASEILWQGLREGELATPGDRRLTEDIQFLLEYRQAATPDDWVRLVTNAATAPDGYVTNDWSSLVDDAFRKALEADREGMLGRAGELSTSLRQQLEAVRLTLGEPEAVSDETLDVIAGAYLDAWSVEEYSFFGAHRASLPKERLARAVARVLPDKHRVGNWQVVEDVLPFLSPAEAVKLVILYDRTGWRSKVLDAVRMLSGGRDLLEAELPGLGHGNTRRVVAYTLAQLRLDAGEEIPESLDEDLKYLMRDEEDEALDRRLFSALPAARAAAIVAPALVSNLHVLEVIDDEGLRDAAVAELERALNNRVAEALGDLGERALGALERGLRDKPSPKKAAQIAVALGRVRTAESAALLVEMLGSTSKVVREAAQKALGDHGSVARDALTAGAKARKKAVRAACEELLGLLDAASAVADTPLARLEAEAAALDGATRQEILSFSENKYAWAQEAGDKADAYGPVVLVVLRDWFLELYDKEYYFAEPVYLAGVARLRGCDAHWYGQGEAREEDSRAAAYVVLDAVARLPKMKKFKTRELCNKLRKHFGAWAADGAASALRTRKTPLAEVLYEIAAKAPERTRDVLVTGLAETGKGAREACVAALGTLGESVVAGVLPSLEAKKKTQREAAARVLAAVGSPKAADALARALKREKSEDVRLALEDALNACGGVPAGEGADEATSDKPRPDADPAAWEAKLTTGKKPRLPKWVELASLPKPRFLDGTELSEEACAALVARLKKEHERPDTTVAELSKALDPAAAAAFGEGLFAQWQQAGKGKAADKWALYQLGHFASDGWICETAPRLDGMSSAGRHALAGWHLDVYARRGSQVGLDWIGFWADNAMTGSLQRSAMETLEAVAAERGVSVSDLRSTLNFFVADEQAERETPDLGFDARGEQQVSYGPRAFTIRLGPDGALSVVEESGKVLERLPKPRKSDDAAAANAAKAAVEQLRGKVGRTLQAVIRRFEQAMVSGRTWSRERFEATFLEHPVMSTVATGLVFASEDGRTFRVSEERTLLDAEGEDLTLPADARVHIAHPLELDAAALEAWRQHVQDADVVQPFEQLSRPTFDRAEELELPKEPIPVGAFLQRVREAGWRRGRPEDAGIVYYDWMRMPGRGVAVQLEHSGYAAGGGWDEPVTLDAVLFETPAGESLSPEQIDPIAWSEAQYAVQALFGGRRARGGAAEEPTTEAPTAKDAPRGAAVSMGAGYPSADLAPSARAKCVQCGEKIEKGAVRIVIEREVETPQFKGLRPGYLHPGCALGWAEAQGLDPDDLVEKVRGNTSLGRDELPEPFAS